MGGQMVVRFAAVLSLSAIVFLASCEDDELAPATTTPTPAETATATPTPSLVPEASAPKEQTPVRDPMRPFGPVSAEPVRVHTGDGDCLNVRPSPGTRFDSDPRTCVPEGYLLWLAGPEQEVDGFTWRYAMGEGWVATQYVTPDPGSAGILRDIPGLLVSNSDTAETWVTTIDAAGLPGPVVSVHEPGANRKGTLAVSADAKWAAALYNDNGENSLDVTNLTTGVKTTHKRTLLAAWDGAGVWSSDGELLVSNQDVHVGVLDAESGAVTKLAIPSGFNGAVWMPDGLSVVARGEYSSLIRIGLDGTQTVIVPPDPGRENFGELSVSPDGTRLMSSSIIGSIRIIDLRTGEISVFARARQRVDIGGRCGGAAGKLSIWVDNDTIAWHESYALKGENGITIGELRDGSRRVLPYFTISDLRTAGPGLLAFVTWENEEIPVKRSYPVTWILDVASGEARPVGIGDAPTRSGGV